MAAAQHGPPLGGVDRPRVRHGHREAVLRPRHGLPGRRSSCVKAPVSGAKTSVCAATSRSQSAEGHDMNETWRGGSSGVVAETQHPWWSSPGDRIVYVPPSRYTRRASRNGFARYIAV